MESRRLFYWILTKDERGKLFLIAGGNTESEARMRGIEILGSTDFEIRGLHTRNLASASSEVRGKRLEDTHSLRKAGERIGHTKSLRRRLMRGR